MKIGYARVSSSGQSLHSQIEALELAGCTKIYKEKKSGTNTNREELNEALDFVRTGDTFVVTRLDRCSRSVKDLHQIIDTLNDKGVEFKATEQELDTTTSSGRLMIGLLSIVSAFETDLRAERQADGIKSAMKRGIKFGNKPKFSVDKVPEVLVLKDKGLTNQDIATSFGIGRSTLLRYVAKYKS
ncbi:MAG: recombinase family protein [Campylobacteraceae bacterium]|jgi:DNA invertase Pin-like site-specific DNA recombinase|nr:recombinase family protein [Campylobacteraceae bacterium]